MANLTNSHSLTAFQRNAHGFIEGLNQTKEPLLLTVNGSVQAVVVDPQTYQEMEKEMEHQRLLAAIAEGEADIQAGRVRPMEEFLGEMKERYGF
jgi:PHD/YefM family antitoxin component YafN of YafNO toxin-antitoxin module